MVPSPAPRHRQDRSCCRLRRGEKAREAEAAGADIIGSDELVAQIQKGEINFDAAIATPNMMAKVGRIGKILGPRGLMPNLSSAP